MQNIKNKSLNSFLNNIKSTINLLNFVLHIIKSQIYSFSTSEVYSNLIKKKVKFQFQKKILIIDNEVIDRDHIFYLRFLMKITSAFKLKTIILRPHNIYGPRMGLSHVIPELIVKILKEQKIYKINNSFFSISQKGLLFY